MFKRKASKIEQNKVEVEYVANFFNVAHGIELKISLIFLIS